MMGGIGENHCAAEAAAEQGQKVTDQKMALHGCDGLLKIVAACRQRGHLVKGALAVTAAAVVEAQVGDPMGIAGLRQ